MNAYKKASSCILHPAPDGKEEERRRLVRRTSLLPQRMIGSHAWNALMRRNLIYRRRHWLSTLFEIALPVCFVSILVAIKLSAESGDDFDSATVPPYYPEQNVTFSPLSFQDYVTAMQAARVCVPSNESAAGFVISGIAPMGYNWQVPFVKCDSRECKVPGENATAYCEYGIVAVSGSNEADQGGRVRAVTFKEWIENTYPALTNPSALPFDFEVVQLFDSRDAMDDYVTAPDYGKRGFPKIIMGIVFEGDDDNNYVYSLRQNSTNFNAPEEAGRPASPTTPATDRLFSSFAKTDFETCVPLPITADQGPLQNSCTGQYMYNGVLTFQRLMGDFILNQTGAEEAGYFVSQSGVQYVQFPTLPYQTSGFYESIENYGPLIVVLGMLFPVASMIAYIVKEKELRQKELIKMMSVLESDIGWSWFLTFFSFTQLTAAAVAGVSTVLYEASSGSLLWLFWILTYLAVVVFCMAIATFTSKSTRAVLIGLLVFFAGVFLTLAVDYEDNDTLVIGAISLHPVAALSYGLKQVGRLEKNGVGLQRSTIDFSENKSGYAFSNTIYSLIIDSLIWGVATWYLNRVIPPDYGQAEPLWFPFLPAYWFPSRAKAAEEEIDETDMKSKDKIPYEPVGDDLKRQTKEGKSIEVRHLCKTFGEKTAVDDLNLSMYSGQITALLGHNGAGKTTTISMLTGAMAPTNGYATVAGKDIRTQIQQIRQDVGICPQHNCLFPSLTVREHIRFFSRLKGLYSGVSVREAEEHIDQVIRDVALFEKRNTLAKNLSGGMKRKLSVAIAFCGGSKVILLDEPTSGMDPFSRRFTWNVIRQYRQDRCIILTTHFMDEADILCDRIAIMAEGRLRCAGSSLFLKKTYGVGYQLTIEKSHPSLVKDRSNDTVITDISTSEDSGSGEGVRSEKFGTVTIGHSKDEKEIGFSSTGDNLQSIVMTAVPEATMLNDVGSEVRYQLPMGVASKFGAMFEGLDEEVEKGTIQSYGMSITTLDEVFLLVARGSTEKTCLVSSHMETAAEISRSEDSDTPSAWTNIDLESEELFFRHMSALFRKRAANFRRDKRAWICTTILPSIFVAVGFFIFTVMAPERNLNPVTLDLNDYNEEVTTPPRNPIIFNSPGNSYTCQPGVCSYQVPVISSLETDELYFFCGSQGKFGLNFSTSNLLEMTNVSCTIMDSDQITSTLTGQAGATAENADVFSVKESSKSLFESSDVYAASQYGGIWFTHDPFSRVNGENGTLYNESVFEKCLVIVLFSGADYTTTEDCARFGGVGYVIQYNFSALHVAPLYQVLADEALVRYATDNPEFTIKSTLAPLPITKVEQGFGEAEDSFPSWFLIVLSFPFIAGAYATFVVLERESKAKHLQTVAGVQPSAYWLSTYLWDILNYQIPLWITVALMFIFDVDTLTTKERDVFSGVVAILFLFGPASAGFSYCVSFTFMSASLCNVVIIISGFLIGMGGPLCCYILILLAEDPSEPKPNLVKAANVITWILRFIPSFCLGKGVFNAINIETFAYLEGNASLSAWSEPILLYEVIFLIGESFFYIILAILLDKWTSNPSFMSGWQKFTRSNLCHRSSKDADTTLALPDDDDVLAEQDRVLDREANRDLIVLSQLTKVYANGKIAVNNMSLGIPHGECFGLLGINGAGKTTTMQMLTAEFPPTSGDATLAGFSVSKEPEKTRRCIGYCPQFDAHFANMTGREHVELYASIKGIPHEFVKEAAVKKLIEVGLSEFDSNRLCAVYSGGMKRRLSLACATIGQPQIVFLDEASTGVDPVARREIWQLVSDMVADKSIPPEERTSVVLTTHSMEECEALCPRIGIMANGRLRCLGSAQHLKNKFGQGYQVELKTKIVDREDDDFTKNTSTLAQFKTGISYEEAMQNVNDTFYDLEETLNSLQHLTGNSSLSDMINSENDVGYSTWKDASSSMGIPLSTLAAFATRELRLHNLETFVRQTFPKYVFRERQDSKVRYEISAEGTRISSIFAAIEAKKEELHLADYGISQTSLEQVFNMHAVEAEHLKQGRDDH